MVELAIEIRDLCYSYPDGTPALQGVSFQVERGESLGLIGPNGAGKSTLLLHLNGILRGDGEVKVGGMPVNDGNLKQIRQLVGLVFQNPEDQLFTPTVLDDVAFGPLTSGLAKEEVEARVAQALEQVGMSGYERRAPHHLSVGEKKRVAIATVLSLQPEILVLDEPTVDLDPRARGRFVRLLEGLPLTKVIAAHDLAVVERLCAKVVVMDQGTIAAQGPTPEILANHHLLAQHGLTEGA